MGTKQLGDVVKSVASNASLNDHRDAFYTRLGLNPLVPQTAEDRATSALRSTLQGLATGVGGVVAGNALNIYAPKALQGPLPKWLGRMGGLEASEAPLTVRSALRAGVVPAIAGSMINSAGQGYFTPTETYAARLGLRQAPGTLAGDMGVRAIGVMQDVGNDMLSPFTELLSRAGKRVANPSFDGGGGQGSW